MVISGDKMKKVIIKAPALSASGYGEHSRLVLRALRTREDIYDVYLANIEWGKCGWIFEDSEERRWLDSLIINTQHAVQEGIKFDMSIQVTIPNEFERLAPINIGVTAGIETHKISPEWLQNIMIVKYNNEQKRLNTMICH